MTSPKSFLRIPADRARSRSTWGGSAPARTAVIRTIGRYNEGIENPELVTGVVVALGPVELLRATYLGPDELTALHAQVDAFNADPDAGWKTLLEDLALNRLRGDALSTADTCTVSSLLAGNLPSASFHYLTVGADWAAEMIRPDIRPSTATLTVSLSSRPRVVITAKTGLGHTLELYNDLLIAEDQAALDAEVVRFNADPATALRTLARDTLIADYWETATEVARLASRQRQVAEQIGHLA